MIASRATVEKAMFIGLRRALAQIGRQSSIAIGSSIAHCSACIPPSEPPIAAWRRPTPRWSSSRRWTVLRSRTENIGNSSP